MWLAIVPAALTVGVLIWALTGLLPGARQRHSQAWIRDQRAPITPVVLSEVQNARWRQRTIDVAGTGLAGLACTAVTLAVGSSMEFDDNYPPFLAFLTPMLLMLVGGRIASLAGTAWQVRGPIRVALPRAPRLTDCISRAGLVAVWANVAVIALLVVAGLWLLDPTGPGFGPGQSGRAWLIAAIAVGSLVAAEIIARRLLRQPLHSSNPIEYFWRDALRAERVRESYRLPAVIGLMIQPLMSDGLPFVRIDTPAVVTLYWLTLLPTLLAIPAMLLVNRTPTSPQRAVTRTAARRAYEPV